MPTRSRFTPYGCRQSKGDLGDVRFSAGRYARDRTSHVHVTPHVTDCFFFCIEMRGLPRASHSPLSLSFSKQALAGWCDRVILGTEWICAHPIDRWIRFASCMPDLKEANPRITVSSPESKASSSILRYALDAAANTLIYRDKTLSAPSHQPHFCLPSEGISSRFGSSSCKQRVSTCCCHC